MKTCRHDGHRCSPEGCCGHGTVVVAATVVMVRVTNMGKVWQAWFAMAVESAGLVDAIQPCGKGSKHASPCWAGAL